MSSTKCVNPNCDAPRDGLENFCSNNCEMEWINDRLNVSLNKIKELERTLEIREMQEADVLTTLESQFKELEAENARLKADLAWIKTIDVSHELDN